MYLLVGTVVFSDKCVLFSACRGPVVCPLVRDIAMKIFICHESDSLVLTSKPLSMIK